MADTTPQPINSDAIIEDPNEAEVETFNASIDDDDDAEDSEDNGEEPTKTIADDAYGTAAVVQGIASAHRMKPELAFKIVELAINYALANRNLRLQEAAAMNPFAGLRPAGTAPKPVEETPTDG